MTARIQKTVVNTTPQDPSAMSGSIGGGLTSSPSTPQPERDRPRHLGHVRERTHAPSERSFVATMMWKREKDVSSETCRPASRQRVCNADRLSTTLPHVTSYHCARAAKRVGMVCSSSSVSG